MKILLTAFEPFNKSTWNSSLEVLKRVDRDVIKKELKVSFNDTPNDIKGIIDDICPDVVVLMGECGKDTKLRLEKVAINYQYTPSFAVDNYGVYKDGEVIVEDGADGIFTNVEIEELNKYLHDNNHESYISFTAGSHLCNLTFYVSRTYKDNYKCIFIHIPKCEVGCELEDSFVSGVNSIIDFLNKN